MFVQKCILFIYIFVSGFASLAATTPKKQNLYIRVCFKNAKSTDTFRISIHDNPIQPFIPTRTETASILPNGEFEFSLDSIGQPVYISLYKDLTHYKRPINIINHYLAESGDSIRIDLFGITIVDNMIMDVRASFSGIGNGKYKCRYELDKMLRNNAEIKTPGSSSLNFFKNNYYDKCRKLINEDLNKYRKEMDPITFDVLKVDFFSMCESRKLEQLHTNHLFFNRDSQTVKSLKSEYYSRIKKEESLLPLKGKKKSVMYVQYVIDKMTIGKYATSAKKVHPNQIYKIYSDIKNNYMGEVRDRALTAFIVRNFPDIKSDEIIDDVVNTVYTDYCIKEIKNLMENNMVGKRAYNFSLPDSNGNIVSLSDFIGKVVFVDFWFTGCSGCARYYDDVVSTVEDFFKDSCNVVFLTISIDTDKKKWMKGIHSNQYTSPDVINVYTDGKGLDHPVIKHYNVETYPRPLLVGMDGNIFSNNYEELRHKGSQSLIKLIQQAVRGNRRV